MTYLFFSVVLLIIALVAYVVLRVSGLKNAAVPTGAGFGVLFLALTGWNSFTTVSSGYFGVQTRFGAVQEQTLTEGVSFVSPINDIREMNARSFQLDVSTGKNGKSESVALSKDQNPLTVDVSFPVMLNKEYAWKVYQKLGTDESYQQALLSEARGAVRDAVGNYAWADAALTKRDQLRSDMQKILQEHVVKRLMSQGFTETEARGTFTILPVNLRTIQPDEVVLHSIALRMAAEQDKDRQTILTEIAQLEAQRRSQEGAGVNNLFAQLPTGFTPDQIKLVLDAISNKTRADALLKVAEKGGVTTMVFEGSGTPAVPVPAPTTNTPSRGTDTASK